MKRQFMLAADEANGRLAALYGRDIWGLIATEVSTSLVEFPL